MKDITEVRSARVKRSKIDAMVKKYGNFNKAINILINRDLKGGKE